MKTVSNHIRQLFTRQTIPDWVIPIFLLLITILAYGLLIPRLGYYQDDWYQIWFERAFGPGIFPQYYASERPFISWLYVLTTSILDDNPTSWHILALLARWVASLSTFWLGGLLMPGRKRWAFWTAVLFAIYPGFRQQYAAVIYSHYFLQYALQICSLGSMVLALRKRTKRWWWIISFITAAVGLYTSEYFFGLEVFRLFVIWIALQIQGVGIRQRIYRTGLIFIPYLVILSSFLYWRLFIFQFPTFQPIYLSDSSANFLSLSIYFLRTIPSDIIELGTYAWLLPIRQLSALDVLGRIQLVAIALSISGWLLVWVFSKKLKDNTPILRVNNRPFFIGVLASGLVFMMLAGWPFWFVNLSVDTNLTGGSRFALSFIPGASLLILGILGLLIQREGQLQFLLSLLVGLALGHHFMDADFYRQVHNNQAVFFQQLVWRAPTLKPGTLVLTNTFQETILMGDNSLTAALNWIYDPIPPYHLDYMLFYIPERLLSGHLHGFTPGLQISRDFRTIQYMGSTEDSLVIFYDYPRCLRVLDPSRDAELPRPVRMPRELREAIAISNLNQIQPNVNPPASLPTDVFKYQLGTENWCYYYEKAELARQQQDWNSIVYLAEKAFKDHPKLAATTEIIPFIEGYARAGQIERAHQLTLDVYEARPDGRAVTEQILCKTWYSLAKAETPKEIKQIAEITLTELRCN